MVGMKKDKNTPRLKRQRYIQCAINTIIKKNFCINVVVLRINIRCVLYRQIKGIIRPNSIAHKKSKLLGPASIEKANR